MSVNKPQTGLYRDETTANHNPGGEILLANTLAIICTCRNEGREKKKPELARYGRPALAEC